ncbi:MAG: tRNA (N6-threonylcarbamoyladenosine(37)-N6)-methyltransferase TrmO [Spirochaetaceae bacterium]|nr:MAG: tRNA (N6-threonylcarbamoyladenosine(37)-N6)-methyltransferase TrmO [Spirochaetaceae bacterium]
MKAKIEMHPIGFVRSPVKEGVDSGWGYVVSDIFLDVKYAAGLKGLNDFSHAVVVFFMHEATFDAKQDLVRQPRGLADMPRLGIFAQRAKHRPNPIGITAVEITGFKDNILSVRGLDTIDNTPVLDIKPYFPVYDSRPEARVPEWVDRLMKGYF